MSYSFSVMGATKDEAKTLIEAEFDKIIASQPVHAADKAAALAAAGAFIDLLTDPPEGKVVRVSMHGSLGWNEPDPKSFTGSGVGVSAQLWQP